VYPRGPTDAQEQCRTARNWRRQAVTWHTGLCTEVVVVARLSFPAATMTRQTAEHRARKRAAAEPNSETDLLGARLGGARVQMWPVAPSAVHCPSRPQQTFHAVYRTNDRPNRRRLRSSSLYTDYSSARPVCLSQNINSESYVSF